MAMSATLRHCRTPELLQDDILRGVRLSRLLQGRGDLFASSPLDATTEKCDKMWAHSEPCEELDAFVSQTWRSAGWPKYLGLLVTYYWRPAALSGLAVLVILCCLDFAGALPTTRVPKDRNGHENRASLWGGVPPLVLLAVLFAGPYCPCFRDRKVFFDAVCINQVDDGLKRAGIYSIAAILAKSRELIILWTPSYFSRLWCVYELATYTAVRPDGKVIFCPLSMLMVKLGTFVAVTAITIFTSAGVATQIGQPDLKAASQPDNLILRIAMPFTFVAMVAAVHYMRILMRDHQKLVIQIERFDVAEASCRQAIDREVILESIKTLYGSEAAFNEYVRGPLKATVMSASSAAALDYLTALHIVSPGIAYFLQFAVAGIRGGKSLSVDSLNLLAFRCALMLFYCPCSIKFFMFVASVFARREGATMVIDFTYTVQASALCFMIFLMLIVPPLVLWLRIKMLGLMYFGAGALLTGLAFSDVARWAFSQDCSCEKAQTVQPEPATPVHLLGKRAKEDPCCDAAGVGSLITGSSLVTGSETDSCRSTEPVDGITSCSNPDDAACATESAEKDGDAAEGVDALREIAVTVAPDFDPGTSLGKVYSV